MSVSVELGSDVVDVKIDLAVRSLYQTDGFTLNPRTGELVTSGYAVSVLKDCERGYAGQVSGGDVREYAADHAAELVNAGNMLGGWVDRETGTTYLDVSTVVFERAQALALAREHNQIAVYDLALGEEIRTGLDGVV